MLLRQKKRRQSQILSRVLSKLTAGSIFALIFREYSDHCFHLSSCRLLRGKGTGPIVGTSDLPFIFLHLHLPRFCDTLGQLAVTECANAVAALTDDRSR